MLHTQPPVAPLRQAGRPNIFQKQLLVTSAPVRIPRGSSRSSSRLPSQCTGEVREGVLVQPTPSPAPGSSDREEAGVQDGGGRLPEMRSSQAGPAGSSSSNGGGSSSSSSSKQRRQELRGHPPWLLALNQSTKWVVSAVAALVLVLKHDAPVMWCLLGSIVSAFINKALKYVINEQRPLHARKADPGMPSSHANSLAFLGVYTAAALVAPGPSASTLGPQSSPRALLQLGAAAVTLCSLFLTWLRVALGYHTVPQVVVGYLLGTCTALAWLHLGLHQALPAISQHATLQQKLQAATYLAGAAFAGKNLKPCIQELLGYLGSRRAAPST